MTYDRGEESGGWTKEKHGVRRLKSTRAGSGLRPRSRSPSAAASGIAVLALEGELDLSTAPKLRARIDEAATGRALVIDLRRVTFVDSAILKELLRARATLTERDAQLVLAGGADAGAPPARPHAHRRAVQPGSRRRDGAHAADRLRGAPAARSLVVVAPAQSQLKPAWSMSLPAEAASTVATARPVDGACRRSATRPSALHAPAHRVHVSSSPTA